MCFSDSSPHELRCFNTILRIRESSVSDHMLVAVQFHIQEELPASNLYTYLKLSGY